MRPIRKSDSAAVSLEAEVPQAVALSSVSLGGVLAPHTPHKPSQVSDKAQPRRRALSGLRLRERAGVSCCLSAVGLECDKRSQ